MKKSCVQLCKIVHEQVELDNSNKDNCCNFIIKRNYHLLDFKKLLIVVLLICRVSNFHFCKFLSLVFWAEMKMFLTLNCDICNGTFFWDRQGKPQNRSGSEKYMLAQLQKQT